MGWPAYALIAIGVVLALLSAGMYEHVWLGSGAHVMEMWKLCAAFGGLLIVLGVFFGKANG